jgi:hypothetical protein
MLEIKDLLAQLRLSPAQPVICRKNEILALFRENADLGKTDDRGNGESYAKEAAHDEFPPGQRSRNVKDARHVKSPRLPVTERRNYQFVPKKVQPSGERPANLTNVKALAF